MPAEKLSLAVSPMQPRPTVFTFKDPRKPESEVGIIAFSYPAMGNQMEDPCDRICGAGILGNAYELGHAKIQLEAPSDPGQPKSFQNALAAFEATHFWLIADQFEGSTGEQALILKAEFAGNEDNTYGGFGNQFAAMQAVLKAKFENKECRDALLKTGDAFLLFHNVNAGDDTMWSDNGKGSGANWLGLQLMLLRDHLTMGAAKTNAWTKFLEGLLNVKTGKGLSEDKAKQWQGMVRAACMAVTEQSKKYQELLR